MFDLLASYCNRLSLVQYIISVPLFTGNDAIVAFARRYEAVVVIHQLNEPLWKVGEENGKEGRKRTKQLHISYHNGDHYNSVRMIGDLQSSGKAANVYIEVRTN